MDIARPTSHDKGFGEDSLMAKTGIASKLLMGAALGAICAPVFAQVEDDAGNSGVIIVTAQRREQNLQETPIAITAVTSEEIELRGISQASDLSAIAPNVAVSGGITNATAAVVTIRGIPTPADETLGFDSPIGLYIDGVYLARSAASSFEVADIERVEVLRGPQGTLFGRNTTGGAINFITRRPSDDASLNLRVGYGSYDQTNVRVVANSGTIDDTARFSLGFLYRGRDGIVDNLLQSRDGLDPGGNETQGYRAALEIDITDNLTIYNVFDYTDIEGVPHANQLTEVGTGVFRPNVMIGGNTFAQVQPANVGGYLANAVALDPECGPPLVSVQRARLDEICLDAAGRSTDEIVGNMTRIDLDLGDVSIRSTTAFRGWDNNIRGSDLDGLGRIQGSLFSQATLFNGMPAGLIGFVLPPGTPQAVINFIAASPVPTTNQPLFHATNIREQDQFSQEIEIVGGSGTSFEWVVGGFYFEESGTETNPQNFVFVLDTNQAVFTDAAFGPLGAAFRAANPARFRGVAQSSTLAYSVESQSYAIYGQGTYRPGGADGPFGITLGLRYTWDEKEIMRTQNGATAFVTAADIALNTQSASFSEPTGHVTLDYRANDDVNLYARAARGYRSGGFNARQTTSAANNIALIPFSEEKIWSFEFGAKTQPIDGLTLNGAVFYNMYTDQQVTVPIPIQGGGSFGSQVVNAGETEYLGIELEARWELSENFSIDGAFGYIDSSTEQFPAADINGTIQNIATVITPGNSPSTTANAAATYQTFLGDAETRLTARVGWTYVSEQVMFVNPLTAPFQQSTRAESRSLVNAQVRIDGIRLGGNGPRFSVTLWGRNILDKEYVSRGIDFGQLGFGSVIYGDPATYGIDFGLEF